MELQQEAWHKRRNYDYKILNIVLYDMNLETMGYSTTAENFRRIGHTWLSGKISVEFRSAQILPVFLELIKPCNFGTNELNRIT